MMAEQFEEFDEARRQNTKTALKEKLVALWDRYSYRPKELIDMPETVLYKLEFLIAIKDAIIPIIQQEIDEACKKAKIEECEYWREIIFSPEQQAIKPTISLTDFQLRIVELSPKESE